MENSLWKIYFSWFEALRILRPCFCSEPLFGNVGRMNERCLGNHMSCKLIRRQCNITLTYLVKSDSKADIKDFDRSCKINFFLKTRFLWRSVKLNATCEAYKIKGRRNQGRGIPNPHPDFDRIIFKTCSIKRLCTFQRLALSDFQTFRRLWDR